MAHDATEEDGHQGCVESAPLEEEIASLRDRLLRALADAENTRRYAKRQVEDARKFAISSFARELLGGVDNTMTVSLGGGLLLMVRGRSASSMMHA